MDQEAKSVRDDPRGFYKRFWATPKMIFGKDPDGKILRQMTYIRTHLGILTEYLVKKHGVDRDKAEDLVLAFMARLFALPAIRENAWGYYRHYVATVVCRRSPDVAVVLRDLRVDVEDVGDRVNGGLRLRGGDEPVVVRVVAQVLRGRADVREVVADVVHQNETTGRP